jgi:type II secretory ATPase GspE/PulE/Tfp pilus assembly ATPase PilB-like protein
VPKTLTPETDASIEAKPASAVRWPAPPFFRLPEPPSPLRRECALQLIDGRVKGGELVEFDTGIESIGLRVAGAQELTRIAFTEIRSIKLTRPIAYVAETAALTALGAVESSEAAKAFEVSLSDGTKMAGKTLGFVKERGGLFLFLVEGTSTSAVNCFVPACQFTNVRIGPPLGAMLLEKHVVSAETLALALNEQTKLRQERIGKYLTDRALVSGSQLMEALRQQGTRPNVRLGEVLIEEQLITSEQLAEALAIQGTHRQRRIGDILIDMGAVSTRLIQFALSDKLGIPYVNAREFQIGPGALEAVDTEFAIRHQALPVLLMGESLVVAVENPLDIDFVQDLRFRTGMSIAPVIGNPQELKVRIAKEYSSLAGRSGSGPLSTAATSGDLRSSAPADPRVADLASQLARERPQSSRDRDVAIDSRVSDNTLVKLVNKIIVEAHAQGASDIHIESNLGKGDTLIRFRKDGDLENYLALPQAYSNSLVSRVKIMADLDISEHRHPQDGKIEFGKHGPLSIELRVAIIPTANNLEDVVLRILGGAEPLPLDQVGFSDRDLEQLKAMIARSYGLILVCGPTGSGKTTTLHSVLREINKPDIKIWTAEDPIEITQPGLRQVQVHPKIDWTFAAAMRAFLRADPDVIMVGEMRDAETTKIGIEASLTGHLVFSTLHTNSAAESIVRLLDLGMDPFNFADALIGILSQRLARKLCPNCKQAHVPSDTELADLAGEYCIGTTLDPGAISSQWRAQFGKDGHVVLRKASECNSCRGGYKGRVVVYELLPGTAEVKHLVRSRASVPQLVTAAQESGMLSLRQNAIEKVLRGVLDLASARAVSS